MGGGSNKCVISSEGVMDADAGLGKKNVAHYISSELCYLDNERDILVILQRVDSLN
jgi:hypothetical protein